MSLHSALTPKDQQVLEAVYERISGFMAHTSLQAIWMRRTDLEGEWDLLTYSYSDAISYSLALLIRPILFTVKDGINLEKRVIPLLKKIDDSKLQELVTSLESGLKEWQTLTELQSMVKRLSDSGETVNTINLVRDGEVRASLSGDALQEAIDSAETNLYYTDLIQYSRTWHHSSESKATLDALPDFEWFYAHSAMIVNLQQSIELLMLVIPVMRYMEVPQNASLRRSLNLPKKDPVMPKGSSWAGVNDGVRLAVRGEFTVDAAEVFFIETVRVTLRPQKLLFVIRKTDRPGVVLHDVYAFSRFARLHHVISPHSKSANSAFGPIKKVVVRLVLEGAVGELILWKPDILKDGRSYQVTL